MLRETLETLLLGKWYTIWVICNDELSCAQWSMVAGKIASGPVATAWAWTENLLDSTRLLELDHSRRQKYEIFSNCSNNSKETKLYSKNYVWNRIWSEDQNVSFAGPLEESFKRFRKDPNVNLQLDSLSKGISYATMTL